MKKVFVIFILLFCLCIGVVIYFRYGKTPNNKTEEGSIIVENKKLVKLTNISYNDKSVSNFKTYNINGNYFYEVENNNKYSLYDYNFEKIASDLDSISFIESKNSFKDGFTKYDNQNRYLTYNKGVFNVVKSSKELYSFMLSDLSINKIINLNSIKASCSSDENVILIKLNYEDTKDKVSGSLILFDLINKKVIKKYDYSVPLMIDGSDTDNIFVNDNHYIVINNSDNYTFVSSDDLSILNNTNYDKYSYNLNTHYLLVAKNNKEYIVDEIGKKVSKEYNSDTIKSFDNYGYVISNNNLYSLINYESKVLLSDYEKIVASLNASLTLKDNTIKSFDKDLNEIYSNKLKEEVNDIYLKKYEDNLFIVIKYKSGSEETIIYNTKNKTKVSFDYEYYDIIYNDYNEVIFIGIKSDNSLVAFNNSLNQFLLPKGKTHGYKVSSVASDNRTVCLNKPEIDPTTSLKAYRLINTGLNITIDTDKYNCENYIFDEDIKVDSIPVFDNKNKKINKSITNYKRIGDTLYELSFEDNTYSIFKYYSE